MKKITVHRASEILGMIANGTNPQATDEEMMLAARIGVLAIFGLGKVGTLAVEMADAAMSYTNQVKQVEGDIPAPKIPDEI